MRIKQQFTLRGAKPSKGDYDGRAYDSTKIYLDLPLSDGNGACTIEYSWGTSDNYAKLENIDLPADVMVDFELMTTGKGQKTIIHDIEVKKSLAVKA